MHEYDKSSKWLIQHHGDSLLRLAKVGPIKTWKPLQAELVQPRQLPDGLLEVQLEGHDRDHLFLIEVATYPEARIVEQVLRGLALVYLTRGELPEGLVLVLREKGKHRVKSETALASPLGLSWLGARWRVVEMWQQQARALLEAGDVGLVPFVPLAKIDEPPNTVLKECRRKIDDQATPAEHANLLAVTQVMTRLRFKDPSFLAIFGGQQAMIESTLIQEIEAKGQHRLILAVLEARFGQVPKSIRTEMEGILEEETLLELGKVAGTCRDIKAFRKRLKG